MNLILCLDDNGGLSFFSRRQSMDSVLREKALELAGGQKLWMDGYSAGQFQNAPERIAVTQEPLAEIGPEDWFFLELQDWKPLLSEVRRLAVFHWNREYPSNRVFPLQQVLANAKLLHREDFPGSSHENITLEVYQL